MQVEVLLFAAVREAAGSDRIVVEVADDACAQDIIAAVGQALPSVAPLMPACRIAIDANYAGPNEPVSTSSEVALIPPVSGG